MAFVSCFRSERMCGDADVWRIDGLAVRQRHTAAPLQRYTVDMDASVGDLDRQGLRRGPGCPGSEIGSNARGGVAVAGDEEPVVGEVKCPLRERDSFAVLQVDPHQRGGDPLRGRAHRVHLQCHLHRGPAGRGAGGDDVEQLGRTT